MKNEIILRHNPHLAAQALDGYLRQIIPVNQYRSFFYIIETADQIDDGGLACTCRAYQCNCFPRSNGKIDIGEHFGLRRRSFVIGKRYIFKFNRPLNVRQFYHIFSITDIRIGIQNIKNPLCCGQIGNYLIIEITQIHDWIPEHINISSKRHKKSYRDPRCPHIFDADQIEHHRSDSPTEIHSRAKHIRTRTRADKRSSVFSREFPERFSRLVFCRKALYYAHSRNIFMDKRVQIR